MVTTRPTATMPRLRLPDPPLGDNAVRLRPWSPGRATDAAALARAWADPALRRWTAVPPPDRRSQAHAARWIAGEEKRRELGLALDLVIVPGAGAGEDDDQTEVLGEVGLGPIDWQARRAAIGWWVATEARGRGIAGRAVTLLARWAEQALELTVYAEIDPANRASLAVAERAGIEVIAS